MNKRGAALLLAVVLTIAVLPAAGILVYTARLDLASALDDYHNAKASNAVRAAIVLVERDLLAGGSGQIAWPDADVTLEVETKKNAEGWQIVITAACGRAMASFETSLELPVDSEQPE